MLSSSDKRLIRTGVRIADLNIYEEDKIWARYSHDKVDIGEELAKVIRTLNKALPLSASLRALSIGSSAEPQFRVLENAFRSGLYLFDIDKQALDIVRERIRRQCTDHVLTIYGDYTRTFLKAAQSKDFLKNKLHGKRVNLISLHHSLYYCQRSMWGNIFENLFRHILGPKGVIHAVLMASRSSSQQTTTWLYNHFAGKFFGCHNDQDLRRFKEELKNKPFFKDTQVLIRTHGVKFFVNDFAKFMAVIWMILLYPNVHRYTAAQKEEIAEFIYRHFWLKKRPLLQMQDHLVVYRGIDFKGLI